MIRAILSALLIVCFAGCVAPGAKPGEGERPSWLPALPSIPFISPKGSKATVISELKPGAYEPSSLAVGEEKDLAQNRGENLGFVRSAQLEQYLNQVRSKIVAASGQSGVPGRVVILASSELAAYSTPDGNVYIAMAWLGNFANTDEVAALLAHELAHVLLRHHSSDLVAAVQRKSQSLYEIGVAAKMALSETKTVEQGDARRLSNLELLANVTEKLALPAWNRGQEREADLLGIDLLFAAGYSPPAMISMLEKVQAWQKQNEESEEAFQRRLKEASEKNLGEVMRLAFQRVQDFFSASHPKTEDRIEDVAGYLERHYADQNLPEPTAAKWKAVTGQPEVTQVIRHYEQAFSAKRLLDKHNHEEAYALAKSAASGRTANDAYPNWIFAKSAAALGRNREATDALKRAIDSNEPIPEIYEELIAAYEQTGQIAAAMEWTDKASSVFGGAPRWTPSKIRLLRKAGRVEEAGALTLKCSVEVPEWRRQCQEANQVPAPAAAAPRR